MTLFPFFPHFSHITVVTFLIVTDFPDNAISCFEVVTLRCWAHYSTESGHLLQLLSITSNAGKDIVHSEPFLSL